MSRIAMMACLLAAVSGCQHADVSADRVAVEATVRKCEEAIRVFDFQKADSLMTPDARWIENGAADSAHDWTGWWGRAKKAGVRLEYDISDVRVEVQGDVAWLTLVLKATARGDTPEARALIGTEAEPARESHGIYSESYVLRRQPGGWRVALAHTSEVREPESTAERSAGDDESNSLIGTWRLVVADDRPDENSRWEHSYGEHPKGYLVYDNAGRVFNQFCTDPPTPPFKAGDDYKPTAREAKTAYVNYVAYFGTYSVDPVRHVVTHDVEGSLEPSYTGTDQERPYQLQGDNLELSDGRTWRRVWMRVPPPNHR